MAVASALFFPVDCYCVFSYCVCNCDPNCLSPVILCMCIWMCSYIHCVFPVFLCKCVLVVCMFVCTCVYEQHLQEGRKAQQYLDHCWKQMDNVSEGGGWEEGGGTERKKMKCLV